MPDAGWWDLHCPELRNEITAARCDFTQAFADEWSLQMDGALMDYARERAELCNKAFQVSNLSLQELIEADSNPFGGVRVPSSVGDSSGPDTEAFNAAIATAEESVSLTFAGKPMPGVVAAAGQEARPAASLRSRWRPCSGGA